MEPVISVILWTNGTNPIYFKECLESVLSQNYEGFELIILDENPDDSVRIMAGELTPHDERIRYRRLGHGSGLAYALNMGIHHSKGDIIFLMGQHDRLDDRMLSVLRDEFTVHSDCDIIYTDHDELQGINRTEPHFKPDFSPELLRHVNYIGDFIAIKKEAVKRLGTFRETLAAACIYDFLLHAYEKGAKVAHIPRLLYHLRITMGTEASRELQKAEKKAYREYITVVKAHLKRMGIEAIVEPDRKMRFWNIEYDGSDFRNHHKDYILIHEDNVKVVSRNATELLYGMMKQPDVAIVGAKFLSGTFRVDNCGYIFDRNGIAYPACHNIGSRETGYDLRAILPREVSMVDAGFCMVDARFYRRAGGFDTALLGRDLMMDLCLKARRAGLRVIYDPMVTVKRSSESETSSQISNEMLMRRWGDVIDQGDPYYNKNLPAGVENYFLY